MEKYGLSERDVKLTSLKREAAELEQEVGLKTTYRVDKVLHVCAVAFQFGQTGEIFWDSFIPMETLNSIGHEVGRNFYPPLIKDALGKKLIEEIKKSDGNEFSIDSIKKIAAIACLMGDMDKKHTIEDK